MFKITLFHDLNLKSRLHKKFIPQEILQWKFHETDQGNIYEKKYKKYKVYKIMPILLYKKKTTNFIILALAGSVNGWEEFPEGFSHDILVTIYSLTT